MIFGKYINRYYLKYFYLIILGISALIAVDIAQLKIPDYVGIIIDGLHKKTLTLSLLQELMINMLWIALIMFIGRFLWRICIFGLGIRVETNLRKRMFKHSEQLSINYYYKHKIGAQMALYTNDLNTIRQTFALGTLMLVDAFFLGALAFYKMFKMSKLITVVAIIPLLLIALSSRFIGKYMREKFKARQKAFEELSEFTQENFSGLSVIKAFVKEGKELLAFRKINQNTQEKNITYLRLSTLLSVTVTIFLNFILIIMIAIGSYFIIASRTNPDIIFSVGDLTKFVSFFGVLTWPMMAIAQLIDLRSQGKASYQRIKVLFDEKIEIKDDKVLEGIDLCGKITFNNLTFNYPDSDINVLKNINLTILPGESIGIIGRTGCGKTALVDILLRLYNLKPNQLLIDDIDIMHLPIKQIRDLIGYVPQDNFLFSDTIHHNIAFAYDELTIEDVMKYAKIADVHQNIIDFSHGYQTIIGERGVTLSGGQKQRISMARALAKEPKILILDDSVSAVDSKTEETILQNLHDFRENRTIILIAHRISSIKYMDKIVLMDDGEIVAYGTHDELITNVKLYQDMVQLQQLEDQVEVNGGSVNNELASR